MHRVLPIHMGVSTKHFYLFERYTPDYLIFFFNNGLHSEISKTLCYTSLYKFKENWAHTLVNSTLIT